MIVLHLLPLMISYNFQNQHVDLREAILAIFRTTCPLCDGLDLDIIVDTHLNCSDFREFAYFTAALVYTSPDGQLTASTLINQLQRWLSSEDTPALLIYGTRFVLDQQCPVQHDAITEEACVNIFNGIQIAEPLPLLLPILVVVGLLAGMVLTLIIIITW